MMLTDIDRVLRTGPSQTILRVIRGMTKLLDFSLDHFTAELEGLLATMAWGQDRSLILRGMYLKNPGIRDRLLVEITKQEMTTRIKALALFDKVRRMWHEWEIEEATGPAPEK